MCVTETFGDPTQERVCHIRSRFQESAKIDAAYVTAETSFDATNIEPPMAPLDSALKTGLDTMLWRHDIIISTCDASIFQRGAMSGAVKS